MAAAVCVGHNVSMRVSINFSINGGLRWDNPAVLAVGNATDIVLSEAGWTDYGSRLLVGADWENHANFAINLQRHGKAYFPVNELGPGVGGSPMNHSMQTWVLASLLVTRGPGTGFFASGVQGYGGLPSPAYAALLARDTGTAVGAPARAPATGVWLRNTTTCVVAVNPTDSAVPVATFWFPSWTLFDGWGAPLALGDGAVLPARRAIIGFFNSAG